MRHPGPARRRHATKEVRRANELNRLIVNLIACHTGKTWQGEQAPEMTPGHWRWVAAYADKSAGIMREVADFARSNARAGGGA